MKCVNSDNGGREKSEENMKSSSSLEKRFHQRKGIVHPHQARNEEKKNHQGEIRFGKSIKL